MANSYTQSSSLIEIPEDKIGRAQAIVDRVVRELETDPEWEYAGFNAVVETTGVWICHDESIKLEHAEKLVRALVEELDLPGIHVVEWATTCGRPLVGSFSGGAFAVRKGRETVWVCAWRVARELADTAPLPADQPHDRPKSQGPTVPSPHLGYGAPLVSAETIAAHYSITGRYVLQLAAEGRIPCLRLGAKCVRFSPSEVARALGG